MAHDTIDDIDVPQFMNSLMSDLQSDAWTRNVKFVLDTSSPIRLRAPTTQLLNCLSGLLNSLLRSAPQQESISLVTEFDASADPGFLKINITAPTRDLPALLRELGSSESQVVKLAGRFELSPGSGLINVCLSFPGASQNVRRHIGRVAVVVDDDVDTQKFLATVLESSGFQVIPVNDGFDALLVIERHKPDLVLTDILMPNMNGIDLITRIRQYRSDLPVIVFSGYRDALLRNVVGLPERILQKPITASQLLSAVDAAMTH